MRCEPRKLTDDTGYGVCLENGTCIIYRDVLTSAGDNPVSINDKIVVNLCDQLDTLTTECKRLKKENDKLTNGKLGGPVFLREKLVEEIKRAEKLEEDLAYYHSIEYAAKLQKQLEPFRDRAEVLETKVKELDERNVVLSYQNHAFEKHWVPKNTLKAAEQRADKLVEALENLREEIVTEIVRMKAKGHPSIGKIGVVSRIDKLLSEAALKDNKPVKLQPGEEDGES